MNMLMLVIGGVLAFVLIKLSRKTDAIGADERIVGNAFNPRILGDALGLSPPSITDKTPVGIPRVPPGMVGTFEPKGNTPITYAPPRPPSNTLQITPGYSVPKMLASLSGGGTRANEPTKSPQTLFSSLVKPTASTVRPPTTSSLSPLASPKSFVQSVAKSGLLSTTPVFKKSGLF